MLFCTHHQFSSSLNRDLILVTRLCYIGHVCGISTVEKSRHSKSKIPKHQRAIDTMRNWEVSQMIDILCPIENGTSKQRYQKPQSENDSQYKQPPCLWYYVQKSRHSESKIPKNHHSAIDTMYNWEVKNTANWNTKTFHRKKINSYEDLDRKFMNLDLDLI